MAIKLYCLNPSCVWRTPDNVCSWTMCPTKDRVSVDATPKYNIAALAACVNKLDKDRHKSKPTRGRSVIGTDKDGKEHRYKSSADAYRAHGISRSNLSNALNQKTRAGGLYWRYADADKA